MSDILLTADVKLANVTTAERQVRDIERRLSGNGSLVLGKLSGQASEFEKSLAAANARVLAFGASAGIIAGVSIAIRGMVSETIKVEKTLTDINVLLGKSSKGIEQFGNSLFSIAKSTGQSFFDVAEAAKEFSRQGLSAEDTLKRTSDAMILTRLTGLDLEKSVSGLTATVNGFAKEMLSTSEIVNRMANVDAQFAVSSKDMIEALSRSSQVAEDAGVSFNEFIAVVTALQQRTARGGAVIGNSLKTIFTRLQRPETLDDLEKFGIAVRDAGGATLPMMDLLRNLVGVYGDLSAAQKTAVSSLAGGVYQINIVKALFSDLGKTVPEYAKALSVANRSTDEAIQRNEALNKSMSATANEASQNILKMAAAGGNLVFGPSIKKVLGGVNQLGEVMDGEGWGQKLGAGLLKGIGNALAGPGLILATVLGAKLFGAFLKYSSGALLTISGIGEASGRILNMQHGIVEMSQQDARIKEILGNTLTSHIQKQTAILAIMREQVTAQQVLNSSARSVAAGLTMRGVTYNPGANVKLKGLAGGYIPTSQIPAQHVMNEVAQASAAGYSISPANVRAMRRTINGAPTTVVYNDREKVIDNFMGSGEPAIIPPNKRLEDMIFGAAGIIRGFHGTRLAAAENFGTSIKPSISGGEGQGAGFYFWNRAKAAASHAKNFLSEYSEEMGNPYMVSSRFDKRYVVPDYEVHGRAGARFLKENPELLSSINNLPFGARGQVISNIGVFEGGVKINTKFGEYGGSKTIRTDLKGSDALAQGEGALLGPIFDTLRVAHPKTVRAFEESFINAAEKSRSPVAMRYIGPEVGARVRGVAAGHIPADGQFANFGGGYKMFPGTKIPTQLNGLLPDEQFTKAFGALDEWFSGLKVKSGKIPRVKFHRDNALFEKEGATAFYEPDANRINLSISGAFANVSNLPTSGSRIHAMKRQLGSQLLHEGFHGGFANINPSARKALLDKVGAGVFGSSTSLREAAKLISARFGPDAGKKFIQEYGHLKYPAEELAAMKFPSLHGFSAEHAAGGILGRKKLLGAFPYSKGGARLGTVEFKEKSDALILDMVTTKMGPDGNRLQGTGILNFAFEQLLRRAKKGGYARVGFTPINGKVIGKAQKLFGKKDSLGNPIDFGNDVFLDTDKFGHLFQSVKNAAGGSDWLQELLEKEKLRDARIAAAKESLVFSGAQSALPYPLLAGSMGDGVQEALLKLETEKASGSYAASRPTSPRAETLAQTKEALGAQAALLRAEANNPSSPIVEVNSFRGGEARSQEGSASSVSLTRQQEEHREAIQRREKKLIALHMRRSDEGYLGPATPLPESFKQTQQGKWWYDKDVTAAHRPGSQLKDRMDLMDDMVSVKPQGKPLGKRLNELRTMAFDWGAVDEAAEDKKYGKIAALSPNATPEQKADHDRATQARNQRLQTKQQAHGQTSQRLMLASFAAPMIGGLATSAIDQSTLAGQQKARTAQGFTSAVGTGIMLGTAVGGPMGAAVGGVVGSVMAIKAAFDGLTPSIEELSEQAKKESDGRSKKFEAMKGVIDIDNAITSGDASPSQVREYYRQRAQKVKEMSPEDRDAVAEAGGDKEKLQEILSNRADANTRADFASRVKTAVKEASEKGFKGQNVQDIVSLMAGTADTSNLSAEDLQDKLKQLQETGSAGLINRSVATDALKNVALGDRDDARAALFPALRRAEIKAIKDSLRTLREQEESEAKRLGVVRRSFSLFMAASNAQSKMFAEGSRQERVGRYVNAAVEYDGRNVETRGNLRNIYAQGFGDYYSESAKRDIESASRVEQMQQGFNGGEMQRKLSAMNELRQVGSGGISSALEGLKEVSKDSIDASRQEYLNDLSTKVFKGFGGMGMESIGQDNFGMPQGEMEQLLSAAKASQRDLVKGGDTDKAQKFTTAITALERSFEDATKVTQKYQDEVAIANAQQIQLGRNLSRELIAQSAVSQFKNVMSGYRFSEGLNSGPQKQSSLLEVGKTSAEIDQFGGTNKNKFTPYASEGNRQLIAQAQGLVIKKAKAIEGAIAEGSIKTKSQMIAEMSLSGGPVSNEQTFLDNYRAQAEIHNEEAKSFDDFKPRSLVPSGDEMADFRKQQGKEFGATYQGQAWTKQKDALAAGYLVSNYQNAIASISERGSSVADIFGDSKNWSGGQNWTKDAGELRALAQNGQVAQLGIKAQSLIKSGRISKTQENALQDLTGSIQTFDASQSNGRAKSYADAQAVAKMGGEDVTKDLLSNTTFTNGLQALELSAVSTSNNTKEMATTLANISSSIKNLERAPITNITVTTTSAKELEAIMAQYQALAKDVETLKKDAPPRNFTPVVDNSDSSVGADGGGTTMM